MDDVPPGDYRIVAFDAFAVPDARWADPAFVRAVVGLGIPVGVEHGQVSPVGQGFRVDPTISLSR